MRKDSVYPSKYLKATDLRDKDVTVTIEGAEYITLQGKPALLVTFKGKEKGLIVKPSVWDQIAQATGCEDSDDWGGQTITLFPTETDFAGQTYEVIRVRVKKRSAPPPRPRPADPADEPDEQIPHDPASEDDDSDVLW